MESRDSDFYEKLIDVYQDEFAKHRWYVLESDEKNYRWSFVNSEEGVVVQEIKI